MIEEKLERIAVSLELIAESFKKDTKTVEVESSEVPTTAIQPPLTAPKQKEEEKKEPIIQLSLEELNEALLIEYERLGDKSKIENVIRNHGAPSDKAVSLSYLDPSKYGKVLEDVKNLI